MEVMTTHGCTVSADQDFGMVQITVRHFPATSTVALPIKDALLLADMIYSLAGADDQANYTTELRAA